MHSAGQVVARCDVRQVAEITTLYQIVEIFNIESRRRTTCAYQCKAIEKVSEQKERKREGGRWSVRLCQGQDQKGQTPETH